MAGLFFQVFIEKPANAHERKYLNTVSVKHVATSIQTHGEGIMSTAVKYAYRFLAQNFMVLSQFLFDEKIESRLAKETGFWKVKIFSSDLIEYYCYIAFLFLVVFMHESN